MVEARLTDDLKLILFDTEKNKEIKSFPKKGTDPVKREAAEAKFKATKQNVKTIVSSQRDYLKKLFLSGDRIAPGQWEKDYLTNPVLMRIAQLLVWNQGETLFTVKGGKTIRIDESDYSVSKDKIGLAHPIEMTEEETYEWQRYFMDKKIKQFFAQVWEPVAFRDPEDLHYDRYDGCKITVGHILSLQNQELGFCDFNIDGPSDFIFAGEMVVSGSFDYAVHFLTERGPDNTITLHRINHINIREPRKLNRVVAYLDQRIIPEKIKQDNDEFLRHILAGKTLAQIKTFLDMAIEVNAEKCKAILLDYRNVYYPDYLEVDEFILD